MAKDFTDIADQYIAESLKLGNFLNTEEINKNPNIDCTAVTLIKNFGSLNTFRFRCLCEIAVWSNRDFEEFYNKYELDTKWKDNHPKKYRIS